MRILIDLTSLYDHLSGIERYAKELSLSMIKQFPENEYVLVFKNEIEKDFTKISVSNNINSIVIKGKNKLFFNQIKLPFYIRNVKADAYLFLAFPEPILFNRKNIYTMIHDMGPWDHGENMKFLSKWYFRISYNHSVLNAKKLITNSNFSKARIAYYFKKAANKTEVVYCGCIKRNGEATNNKTNDWITVKEKYKLPDKYILTLSTLEPRKNLKLLLEGYEVLLKEKKSIPKLVLAGRMGWKMEGFLNGYSEELLSNLIFTGFVDDEDLGSVYSNADFFVFPSMYEGFGMPPLEAMGFGSMVLSSDTTSMPEILGDAAIYFKSGNVSDLSEKIKYMMTISEDDRTKYILAGALQAQNYSWDIEASKLIKIIRNN